MNTQWLTSNSDNVSWTVNERYSQGNIMIVTHQDLYFGFSLSLFFLGGGGYNFILQVNPFTHTHLFGSLSLSHMYTLLVSLCRILKKIASHHQFDLEK